MVAKKSITDQLISIFEAHFISTELFHTQKTASTTSCMLLLDQRCPEGSVCLYQGPRKVNKKKNIILIVLS